MRLRYRPVAATLLAGSLIWAVQGCNQAEQPAPVAPPEDATALEMQGAANDAAEEPGEAAASGESMEAQMAGLKELSPEDYESAMKQHVCPVSGQMLGSMGKPEKVEVNGESLWICCDACRDKVLAEPEKYLEKVKG